MSETTATSGGRDRRSFDRDWWFHRGEIAIPYAIKAGLTGGPTDVDQKDPARPGRYELPPFRDEDYGSGPEATWKPVTLPHDFVIEGQVEEPADKDPTLHIAGHGYLPVGVGFYRKVFTLPASECGRRVLIEFDGVYRDSTVWLNGHPVGRRQSGYASFHYDITDLLRYGDEGRNCMLVRVDAASFEGWWYEGGGLYRHVWLTTTEPLHFAPGGVFVSTPRVTAAQGTVSVTAELVNDRPDREEAGIACVVLDSDGAVVGEAARSARIPGLAGVTVQLRLCVPQPRRWSLEDPYLYTLRTEIRTAGRIVDRVDIPFGMRTIRFTPNRGFFLNGRRVVLKGMCVHQDFAGVGVALPDRLHAYKIERLKAMGCNAYRCSHHPPAPELLDACDRLGMLVMDENRQLTSSPEGLENIRSMVRRDRNHPSVIMWSMENEEPIAGTSRGTRILTTLARLTRQLDPTRPVATATNHDWNKAGYADAVDLLGYNYAIPSALEDHHASPERRLFASETHSTCCTRGVYAKDPVRAYCPAYPEVFPFWGGPPEKDWKLVAAHPELTGLFVWTGFDYKGEPIPYTWPNINCHFGVMDICGFAKDSFYYFKSAWTEAPMVHAFPHWTWPGREGTPISVWVYSNCGEVELLLNGRSLGRQSLKRFDHLEWTVPYEAGELRARGYRAGLVVAESRVATAGGPAQVKLEADRPLIRADGGDVSVITARILDSSGNVVPTAGNRLDFEVMGPGRIIGVGNGDPSCLERDKANWRSAFNGLALLLVQSTGESGAIRIRAVSEGLAPAQLCVNAHDDGISEPRTLNPGAKP